MKVYMYIYIYIYIYIDTHQLCTDTKCHLEDLSGAMEVERERDYIYIYFNPNRDVGKHKFCIIYIRTVL